MKVAITKEKSAAFLIAERKENCKKWHLLTKKKQMKASTIICKQMITDEIKRMQMFQ